MKNLIVVLALLALAGCAQAPEGPKVVNQIESNIGSGINTAVDYIANAERTALFLTVNNKKAKQIRIWMVIKNETDGAKVVRSDRIYSGSEGQVLKTFRLKKADQGVTETVQFDVFDDKGVLLMSTEPIINSF